MADEKKSNEELKPFDTSIEALNRDFAAMYQQMMEEEKEAAGSATATSSSNTSSDSDSDDVIRRVFGSKPNPSAVKMKKIVAKAVESSESSEAYEVFKAFYECLVQLQNEVSRLESELEKVNSENERVSEKLEKKKMEVKALRLSKSEVELEILCLLRNKVVAVLDPQDRKTRAEIGYLFKEQIEEAKVKAEENRMRTAEVAEEQRGSKLTWPTVGAFAGAMAAVCRGRKSEEED